MLSLVPYRSSTLNKHDVSFERLFDDVLSSWSIFDRLPGSMIERSYRVEKTDGKLKLEIDLPGLKPDDVTLQIEGDAIVVSGKQRGKEFRYLLNVDPEYDIESTQATMDAGVLLLELTPTIKPEPRKIVIKVHNE